MIALPEQIEAAPKIKVNAKLNALIDERVLALNKEHAPSGRLSAGKLGWPLQWQMLHYFKVAPKPLDAYTLRKFQRGKDVEDRIVEWSQPQEKQFEVNYRGVIGIIDMVLDGDVYEVKSVTNAAFKYIIQKTGARRNHRLQGMLYAKATKRDIFFVTYVASDDYRTLTFECDVTDELDGVITEYEAQAIIGEVPVFAASEKWHSDAKYSPYPDWMNLTEEQIAERLKA